MILNLLLNSQDAIEEKMGIVKTEYKWLVDIRTYKNKYFLHIEVMDNGMGIKSADLDKIMLPFHTTKKAGKGTGLGLSISFGIIKEMNGTIDIESEYARWTKVKISLPLESENKHSGNAKPDHG
ncbi:MAG: ATP-binding protein [Bacteroidetes bacterium]|nr:ATP-binding protein [Bacteroidota bacterium]